MAVDTAVAEPAADTADETSEFESHWSSVIDEAVADFEGPADKEPVVRDVERNEEEDKEQPEAKPGDQPRDEHGRFASTKEPPQQDTPVADDTSGDVTAPKGEEATDDEGLGDLQRLAMESYGLKEQELQDLSATELRRTLRILDSQLYQRGVAVQQAQQPRRDVQPQQEQQQPQQPAAQPQPGSLDEQIAKLREAGYDEELLEPLKAVAARVDGLEQYYQRQLYQQQMAEQQRQQQAQVQEFMSALAEINEPELFGDPNRPQPTQSEQQNLQKLIAIANGIGMGFTSAGLPAPSLGALLKRAYQFEFADHIANKTAATRAKALKEQSRRVMGTGQKTKPASDLPSDVDPDVELDPEIAQFFARIKREQG